MEEGGLSVGLSVTVVNPAKTDELFCMWARVGPRNKVLHGVEIPYTKGEF